MEPIRQEKIAEWRRRAEEFQAQAELQRDPLKRETLLSLARSYILLAEMEEWTLDSGH